MRDLKTTGRPRLVNPDARRRAVRRCFAKYARKYGLYASSMQAMTPEGQSAIREFGREFGL